MKHTDASLKNVLEPVREAHLSAYIKDLQFLRTTNDAVATEVAVRGASSEILRDGVLNLPSRNDFELRNGETRTVHDVHAPQCKFDPFTVKFDDKMDVNLRSFRWDTARLSFDANDDTTRLLRLRLWFLEWFQPRMTGDPSLLAGVVHRIDGPQLQDGRWNVTIDLGSAPTDAFIELVHMFASRGVKSMALGHLQTHVE